MKSIFRPTEEQWDLTTKIFLRYADGLAFVFCAIALHFIMPEFTWRYVAATFFFNLAIAIIKWRCS